MAGVKSSNFQFSRQVKDIKSSALEELQTERSTVIASTRPAPLDQLTNKQTTPSLPNSSSTLNTETSDQLVRRASLSKTNLKSGMCVFIGKFVENFKVQFFGSSDFFLIYNLKF